MRLNFTKMTGAGNDFILFDNRDGAVVLDPHRVRLLCDRHKGVGADGVMAVVTSGDPRADFAWQFYNSDGSEAEMCGNGARCFARYVQRLTGTENNLSFQTAAGIIGARFLNNEVEVNLTQPSHLELNLELELGDETRLLHTINTGVPHAVMFVSDADKTMVSDLGRLIRFHSRFQPRGTNVNFVQVTGKNAIRVRTYERGVEGETLACGTGVTASALVSSHVHQMTSPIHVQVQGGDVLKVGFQAKDDHFEDVRLCGPADFVFDGVTEIR